MKKIFLILGVSFFLNSCFDSKENEWKREEYKQFACASAADENAYIAKWTMENPNTQTVDNELYKVILQEGTSIDFPSDKDTVYYIVKCSFLKSPSTVWYNLGIPGYDSVRIISRNISELDIVPIKKGLKTMRVLEKSKIVTGSINLYSNIYNDFGIDSYTPTIFELQYLGKGGKGIRNYEDTLIERYINQKTSYGKSYSILPSNGLYYAIKSAGDLNQKVTDKSLVSISYKSYFLNGHPKNIAYDASSGSSYAFSMASENVPVAVKSAIKQIGLNGSVVAFARYDLAKLGYSAQPQYQPMVFEITLKEIK